MKLQATERISEDPLTVSVNPGHISPFATIDLTGDTYISLHGLADCDQLITAAVTAKRMLELTIAGTPHAFTEGAGAYGRNCARCGQQEREALHEPRPCPSVLHSVPCTVTAPGHEWHHGPDTGGSVRQMWQDSDVLAASIASGQPVIIAEDEPAPGGYVTAEEAARHVAARLGATADGEPLFDGPVTTKADLDEAYDAAAAAPDMHAARDGKPGIPCDCGQRLPWPVRGEEIECLNCHAVYEHDGIDISPGARLKRPGSLRIAPGGSAGPASLGSVAVQPSGFVTADAPVLRGARIGGGA